MGLAENYPRWVAQVTGWAAKQGAADPDDIVAEAFTRAYVAEQAGAVIERAWIYTTVRHLLIDQARYERIRPTGAMPLHPAMPADVYDFGEDSPLLAEMTLAQRALVLLRAEGLSLGEAAARLGIGYAAAVKLAFRARQHASRVVPVVAPPLVVVTFEAKMARVEAEEARQDARWALLERALRDVGR